MRLLGSSGAGLGTNVAVNVSDLVCALQSVFKHLPSLSHNWRSVLVRKRHLNSCTGVGNNGLDVLAAGISGPEKRSIDHEKNPATT